MKHIIYCPVCGKKNKLKQYTYVDQSYGSTKKKKSVLTKLTWFDFATSKYLEVICSCNANIEFSIIKRKQFCKESNNTDVEYSAYLSYRIEDYNINIVIVNSNNGKFYLHEMSIYKDFRTEDLISKTDFNFYPKNKNELLALLMLS